MGIISLVLSIIAIVTSFIPVVNNISFFVGLIGVAFGIVGIVMTSKGKSKGKELAVVGLTVSVISVVLVLTIQLFFNPMIADIFSEDTGSSAASSELAEALFTDVESAPYEVTIDDCQKATDYNERPAIVVTLTWTNNSDEERSFVSTLTAKGYQNGTQLETAIVADIDSQSIVKQLEPGATCTVQMAFLLDDQSDVTVKCEEFSIDDSPLLAERTFLVV